MNPELLLFSNAKIVGVLLLGSVVASAISLKRQIRRLERETRRPR